MGGEILILPFNSEPNIGNTKRFKFTDSLSKDEVFSTKFVEIFNGFMYAAAPEIQDSIFIFQNIENQETKKSYLQIIQWDKHQEPKILSQSLYSTNS